MSTFDGKVTAFPDIRIDFFRNDPHSRPPLAFFLSHIHSDHLVGLETCKSPFIYCSPGTRDILLRLEKYPHRMNFAKGILETRKQTYRHLKNLLKAIPLETPTILELAPGNEVRVTLFDANHCVGAVMFLIEGKDKAVLYTGDIRSENWWVDSLKRNPVLAPYVTPVQGEPLKKLDCMYLDTTFVVSGREDPYCHFVSKADGINELLQRVAKYPKDTQFYVDAWTFGYEDVWQALSNFLGYRVHVDAYKYGLYRALANGVEPRAPEAVKMIGFHCGNHYQYGCLTSDQSQIHSCEKGTACEIWGRDFVRITPIVARHNGIELAEPGTGGGQGDLAQQHELELADPDVVSQLMMLCVTKLQQHPQMLKSVLHLLSTAMANGTCGIDLEDFDSLFESHLPRDATNEADPDTLDMSLDNLVSALTRLVAAAKTNEGGFIEQNKAVATTGGVRSVIGLPKQITFPYSRHSSYQELCVLVEAFEPLDIHPCTVDERDWKPQSSMNSLFGYMYDGRTTFSHDQLMLKKRASKMASEREQSRPESSSNHRSSPTSPAPKATAEENGFQLTPLGNASPPMEEPSEKAVVEGREQAHRNDAELVINVAHHSGPANPLQLAMRDPLPPSSNGNGQYRMSQGNFLRPRSIDRGASPSTNYSDDPRAHHELCRHFPAEQMTDHATGHSEQPQRSDCQKNVMRSSPPNAEPVEHATKHAKFDHSTSAEISSKRTKHTHERAGYDRMARSDPTVLATAKSWKSSSRIISGSPQSETMAFRNEAYNAVQGTGELDWFDIGLVSVGGHQEKEEEL